MWSNKCIKDDVYGASAMKPKPPEGITDKPLDRRVEELERKVECLLRILTEYK